LNKKFTKGLALISLFVLALLTLFSYEIYNYGNPFQVFSQDSDTEIQVFGQDSNTENMSNETQIRKILEEGYLSNDFDIIIQSIDTVASYGTMAVDDLLRFSEVISDFQLKKYIFLKIQEIKDNTTK
jgi:hypothetical protein